jgi:enoyl-CoA hydratase
MTSPALHCFTLDIHDHIAHLVLNRPEAMNTMDPVFWRELDGVLDALQRGNEARALVISSTGRHFSAGMALEVFGSSIQMDDQSPEGRAAIFELLGALQATFTRLETLRIPVIAAIQGGCIGGAVDLVTAACIRYASADAFFCIQEINIGLVADVGTLQRLPKLVPLGVVKELAYTGRRMPAARAREVGLVNEVFDSPAACLEGAHACARDRRQAAGGHLGQQAGHRVRARALHARQPAPDGLGAGSDLEPCARARGRGRHEGQARGAVSAAGAAARFWRLGRRGGRPHVPPHRQRLHRLAHVVHAHDARAALDRQQGGGHAGADALGRRRRRGGRALQRGASEDLRDQPASSG